MFKNAATKLAHNSTIPALSGNRDLRPLQDLILAEKAVLISLQKLSVDYSKAAEALRAWGLSEGDDLGDILSASTTILNHFASALSQYASHGHAMRDNLKAIRTREENQDELKRRRRAHMKKAEDAERKLAKMSPENKNLHAQTDLLNRLRDEIRAMDADIMTEEAALGDFKRTATRIWMGLKFGGLLECCEKGTIAAEYGKMIISEVSEEITQPGLPRSMYQGFSKTEQLTAEAHRCINDVQLSTVASVGFRDRRQYSTTGRGPEPPQQTGYGDYYSPIDAKPMPPPPARPSDEFIPPRPFTNNDVPGSPASPSYNSLPSIQGPSTTFGTGAAPTESVDDFGVTARSGGGLMPDGNPYGGRFATFPVKTRPPGSSGGYTLSDGPPRHDLGQSFSSSVAEALDGHNKSASAPPGHSILPPPPGAAPPAEPGNPWADTQDPPRSAALSDNDDALLAYMTAADASDDTTPSPTANKNFMPPILPKQSFDSLEDDPRISRHVRFGSVEDVQEGLERRSLDKDRQDHDPVAPSGLRQVTVPDDDDTPKASSNRVPLAVDSDSIQDEKALNAAAAREITKELEVLKTIPDSPERGRLPVSPLSPSYSNGHNSRDPSPLAPPSAPFTKRGVSPAPYPDAIAPSSPTSTQSHGHSFQSSIPSPTTGTSGTQAPPPPINLPDQQIQDPRIATARSAEATPAFRTPPEYPRNTSYTRPNISFNAGGGVSPGAMTPPALGARTISAAAFKRPAARNMSSDNLSSNPDLPSLRKAGLPGSPYPMRDRSGTDSSINNGLTPGQVVGQPSSLGASPVITPAAPSYFSGRGAEDAPPPPPSKRPISEFDAEYDYLNEYVHSRSNSPSQQFPPPVPAGYQGAQYGGGEENRAGLGAGGPRGYGNGNFATNLDSGLR